MSTPYHVEVNREEGFIRIARHSREMLYWEITEWEEDPDVAFVIAEAISTALTNPEEMDTKLAAMGKIQ